MLQAAPLPAPTAEPGGTRAPPLPPGRAPRGADRKSGSGRRKPVRMCCFVCPPRSGAGGEGSDGLPGGSSGVPAATGRPMSDVATLASQVGAPGAQPRSSAALSLFPSPSSPCPAWSPEQLSPRPALHRCLEWRWGKPLPEEAAPTGSGGALEPPAGRHRLRPGAAGSRQPRGGGVGAGAGARSRSAARLRVVGSPSPPAPGRGRSTTLI